MLAKPNATDPEGVLVKPIPDKLVVLTFDDAPASHATVVAPILKSHGFGGSFYKLTLEGKEQTAGTYSATGVLGFIGGTGVLIVGS